MSENSTSRLDVDALAALGQRIATSETETFQSAADRFALPLLCASLLHVLDATASVVAALPDAAFGPQPDDVDGSDVWSAGEIVGHLAEMEVQTLPFWERVCGAELPNPPPAVIRALSEPPAGHHVCGGILGVLRDQNARILERVVDACSGDERAMHFALGLATVRAAILGSCIHLVDHHQQLLALSSPSTHRGHVR